MDINPNTPDVLGPEWFPYGPSSYYALDSASKAIAMSMDQTVSQDIGTIELPNLGLPIRGGMYAIEVYDGEDAVAVNSTSDVAAPNQDVSLGNWTDEGGGTTTIYDGIDEATASTADYIKVSGTNSTYSGRLDTGSLSLTGKRILGVKLTMYVQCGPTGVLVGGLNIGGSNYAGLISYGPKDTPEYISHLWTTNPSNGEEWTIADVQAFDTTDEWYAVGSTVASVWSAVVIYWVQMRVYYCDENRIAVGYLDDTASGLTDSDWNAATVTTPTGGTWTKDGTGRHLYLVRRINDTGSMLVPTLTSATVPDPASGWAPTIDPTYGVATVMGDELARLVPIVQITTGAADSADSQPYVQLVEATVYFGQNAEQEYSDCATDDYGVVRFLASVKGGTPTDDLQIRVKRRSDDVQYGATLTLTVDELAALDSLNMDGWKFVELQMDPVASLTNGTQYYLVFSTATLSTADPWYVMALDTLDNANSTTFGDTTDRASVNGTEADRYDLPATLSTIPSAPSTFDGALSPVTVTTSPCGVTEVMTIGLSWTQTSLSASFDYYEIQRKEATGDGDWHTIEKIDTDESVVTFADCEARRGVALYYRIRVHRTDGAFSAWKQMAGSITKSVDDASLEIGSNYLQVVAAFDYQPDKSMNFPEDSERVVTSVYGRDRFLAANPTEDRGVLPSFTLNLAGGTSSLPAVDGGTAKGVDGFSFLRKLARQPGTTCPYLAVLDQYGNRLHGFLRVPDGTEHQPGDLYVCQISVVEVRGPDDPYVPTHSSIGTATEFS